MLLPRLFPRKPSGTFFSLLVVDYLEINPTKPQSPFWCFLTNPPPFSWFKGLVAVGVVFPELSPFLLPLHSFLTVPFFPFFFLEFQVFPEGWPS